MAEKCHQNTITFDDEEKSSAFHKGSTAKYLQ